MRILLIYKERSVSSKGNSASGIAENFDSRMFIAEHFDVPEIIVEVIDAPRSIAEEIDLPPTIAEHFSALLVSRAPDMLTARGAI